MADILYKPQTVLQIDDKAGNSYTIYTVQHVASGSSDENAVRLDPAYSVAARHLPNTGQTQVTMAITAAAAWSTVSFPAESASGAYTIVVRGEGSAAGVSGFKNDL